MHRRTRLAFALVLATALLMSGDDKTASAQSMSEQKRVLIHELLQLQNPGGTMMKQITEMSLAQSQVLMGDVFDSILKDPNLSEEQRGELRTERGRMNYFTILLNAKLSERLDLDRVLYDTYAPLYAKYFDEIELQELVVFARTPTGRKSLEVMPQISAEAAGELLGAVVPQMMSATQEVLEEMRSAGAMP